MMELTQEERVEVALQTGFSGRMFWMCGDYAPFAIVVLPDYVML